jgi:hypothetical protein
MSHSRMWIAAAGLVALAAVMAPGPAEIDFRRIDLEPLR